MAKRKSIGNTAILRDLKDSFTKYSAKKFYMPEYHLRMKSIKASPLQVSRLECSLHIARAENCDTDMVIGFFIN